MYIQTSTNLGLLEFDMSRNFRSNSQLNASGNVILLEHWLAYAYGFAGIIVESTRSRRRLVRDEATSSRMRSPF